MIERKTFTFDGENSADYGLYISGDSVYNAPTREVDMIPIPGRNGQLAIDMGRYENITVTYPAFVFADTQAEFREKIRRIRNWLCSKTSYQRLTDEYNPESFRLGLYKSGLEVEPIFYNRCGEFEMSFDCKPQRFLFIGEEVFTLGEWGETETYSGSIVSFEGTETTAIKSLKVNITPKQSGSGDPSLSNVRPISGYEGVNVTRCGKNFLIVDTEHIAKPSWYPSGWSVGGLYGSNGYVANRDNNTGGAGGVWADLKAGTYTISGEVELGKCTQVRLTLVNYGHPDTYFNITPNAQGKITQTIVLPNDGSYAFRLMPLSWASGVTRTMWFDKLQLEIGSTATDFEPYQGTSYPISLGQTVYGGTLNVVSGKLIIDSAKIVYDGTLPLAIVNWAPTSNGVGWAYGYIRSYNKIVSDTVVPKIYSDKLKASSYGDMFNGRVTNAVGVYSNNSYGIFIRTSDTSLTTVEAVNAYLSANPITVVYELATPTEIQLTPTQVTTLLGYNNIWADAGTVEVTIGQDPYILINPTKFEACPVFEVEGAGTLSVGDSVLTISNTGTTIIDTEMMEAYEDENGAIVSRNDEVAGGFPTLNSGINKIETDGLDSVKVKPNWWEL